MRTWWVWYVITCVGVCACAGRKPDELIFWTSEGYEYLLTSVMR